MIDPRSSDLLLIVTAVTVAIGMFVMLFGLLVPREQVATSGVSQGAASASLAKAIAAEPPLPSGAAVAAPVVVAAAIDEPPPVVKESTFAAIVAEARRTAEPDQGFDIDEMLRAPLVEDLAPDQAPAPAPVSRSSGSKRITWPSLVDETAIDCDLPTRLRLIEGLSFIGGSWSIDILARAYEQELDANVRGAIFVALRDARSAA